MLIQNRRGETTARHKRRDSARTRCRRNTCAEQHATFRNNLISFKKKTYSVSTLAIQKWSTDICAEENLSVFKLLLEVNYLWKSPPKHYLGQTICKGSPGQHAVAFSVFVCVLISFIKLFVTVSLRQWISDLRCDLIWKR